MKVLTRTALLLLAASACAAADGPPESSASHRWLPVEVVSRLQDRTSLDANAENLATALRQVVGESTPALHKAAEEHGAARLRTLAATTGGPRGELAVYEDLMRFPQASRGEPVSLSATVTGSEAVKLNGTEARLLRCKPVENPKGSVAVLLPTTAEPPAIGQNAVLSGVFVMLVELQDERDAKSQSMPLIIAPELTPEPNSENPALEASEWSVVRHRSFGVRAAEKDLYYRVLKQAAQTDEASLRQAARDFATVRQREAPPKIRKQVPFPTFVDLFKNFSAYEGKPVTLKGHAREIRKYPAGDNTKGLDTLYEAWIYTEDSETNPAVVVASGSPDLPIGDDLQVPVEATGYFFKIYAYHGHDTARVAPMILAGRIEMLPEPAPAGPPAWLLILVGLLFASLIVWLVVSYVGTRKPIIKAADVPPDFTAISTEDEPRE
jgi:hypothetical protein